MQSESLFVIQPNNAFRILPGILLAFMFGCQKEGNPKSKGGGNTDSFTEIFPMSPGNRWEYFNQSETQESFILILLSKRLQSGLQVMEVERKWRSGPIDTVKFEIRENGELWFVDPLLTFEKETLLFRSDAKQGECGILEVQNCLVTENFQLPNEESEQHPEYKSWLSKAKSWRTVSIKENLGIVQIRRIEYITPWTAYRAGLSDAPDKGALDTVAYVLKRYQLQSGASGEF
jgi:hypothetical protein